MRRLGAFVSSFSLRRFDGKSDMLALFFLLLVITLSVGVFGEMSCFKGVGSFFPLSALLPLEIGVVLNGEFRLTSERIRLIEDGGGSRGE